MLSRRRAELDRRACTRSCCSSDTDSRCRLHWSRLTGRDYYKGGWRDVRIYTSQGMRRTCMLLSTTRHRNRERERFFFNSTFPSSLSLSLSLFFSFSSTCSVPLPSVYGQPFADSLVSSICPSKNRCSFSSVYATEIPRARNTMQPFSETPSRVDPAVRMAPSLRVYLLVNNEIDRIIRAAAIIRILRSFVLCSSTPVVLHRLLPRWLEVVR